LTVAIDFHENTMEVNGAINCLVTCIL